MSDPNRTLAGATKEALAQMMVDNGVPHEKAQRRAHEKVSRAGFWWGVAAVFMVAALGFAGGAFYIALQREMTVVLGVMLGVFIFLPTLAAFYCVSQADPEASKTFVGHLLRLRKLKNGNGGGAP